jgi:hypothetical protein
MYLLKEKLDLFSLFDVNLKFQKLEERKKLLKTSATLSGPLFFIVY